MKGGGRLPGLDAVKGVAIAMVVLIHAAPTEPAWYDRHFIGGIARLGVPVFLLVTGFLASFREWTRARLAAACSRFVRLHVIYGLLYWAFAIARDGMPERLTWKGALLPFAEASWPGQFYFLVLIQTFFVSGVLLPEGAWRRPAMVVVSGVTALAGFSMIGAAPSVCAELGLPVWVARPFTTGSAVWLWFYYFTLGAYLGEWARRSGDVPSGVDARAAAVLVTAGVLIAAVGLPTGPVVGGEPTFPYARLSILVGATLVGLCLPFLARQSAPRAVQRIGAATFGVFVLNPAILGVLLAFGGATSGIPGSWLRAAGTIAVAVPLTSLLRRRVRWLLP